ncbi:MAG: RNA polymerase factor sigma-54 [Oligoflexia bacterium]|nr:RNA polymerase factor sigma-54 [Oligoflexia bacterium]
MKITHDLKQTQNLLITPQLRQAIEMLTVPHLEMTQIISKELTENPLLEEAEGEIGTGTLQDRSLKEVDQKIKNLEMQNQEVSSEDFNGSETLSSNKEDQGDWNNYIEENQNEQQYLKNSSTTTNNSSNNNNNDADDMPNYENILSKGFSLAEHLLWQLQMSELTEEEFKIGETIIHNLNDSGFLDSSIEEITEKGPFDTKSVLKVLEKVQTLDPIGCGAKDLQESLLIQAKSIVPRQPLVEKILLNYFQELQDNNYNSISKKEKISENSVLMAFEIIKELNPRPGKSISSEDTRYVVPDVYVYHVGSQLVVSANDEGVPRLKVSNYYQSIIEQSKSLRDQSTKDYLQDKLKSAVWLIKSIQNRQKTILKVAEAIVKLQPDFFKKGITHLKPMILKDIANDIGMHESTVSRVTVNKYMHTPLGIFELKFFFNTGIGGKDGGTDVAAETLKLKIKQLINMEDSAKPLSDQKIVEILAKEDINVARRTIAKYREMMSIPASADRKKKDSKKGSNSNSNSNSNFNKSPTKRR